MYKLVIVDDEPSARYGLRDYFDWKAYNIEVVGEADDGENALELIEKTLPDIVLTDVKMPNIDGIQLSSILRSKYDKLKIIFISGHDDIAYLKSALKVDAIDYIFKPVNLKELAAVVEKVVGLIQQEEQQKSILYKMEIKLIQSMPLLKEKFFMSLIREGVDKQSDIQSKAEFLELDLPVDGQYIALIVSVDDQMVLFEGMTEKDRQLTSFAVLNICQELIERFFAGYIFENAQGEYVGVLHLTSDDDQDRILELANEIRDNLMNHLQLSITIGIGIPVVSLPKVSNSYRAASEAVSQKLFLGKNRIITIDNLNCVDMEEVIFDFSKVEKLLSMIKAGDGDRTVAAMGDIFQSLYAKRSINIKYCQNICMQIVLEVSRILIELDINTNDLDFKQYEILESVAKAETLEDMKNMLSLKFLDVCKYLQAKRNSKSRSVIEQVKELIHKHYSENLTVNDIAGQVYLTSTYLCMIFKQETGDTINDYITKTRLEKAKELLRDHKNKLYDICFAIGYSDPSYFTKQFKKYTGLSPSEYKEKLL